MLLLFLSISGGMKNKIKVLLGGLKKTKEVLLKLHKEGPFGVHLKLHKINWYASWHQKPHHKSIHAAILAIYILSIVASIFSLPNNVEAAWNNTKTWTTKSDFETGTTLTNVVSSGDNDENDANNNDSISLTSQAEKRQTFAAGINFSLAIKTDGTLWSTGYNEQGALGLGDFYYRNTWTQVPISDVVSVSASYHSLALKSDGTVWASGRNDNGQLADGTISYRNSFVQTKIDSSTYLTNVKKIIAGIVHSLAITNDNKLYVSGVNTYGQLGTGDKVGKTYWTEITNFGGLTNFEILDICGGERTSMVLIKNLSTNQNEVYGAGRNEYGELGLGDNVEHISWTLSPLSNVVDIDGSAWHYSAVVKSDTENYVVYSVGSNGSGRLGVGDVINRNTWTPTNIENVSDLYAGASFMYAKKYDGSFWGTGSNSVGQLYLGDTTYRASWVPTGFSGITQASIANAESALLLKQNGELLLIGYDSHDQSGLGENHYRNIPAQTDLVNPTALYANYYTSYAIKNGYLYSAGLNSNYQGGLTDGLTRDKFTQTGISNVSKAVGGLYHLLVLKNDGTVWGMGQNSYGQLGITSTTTTSTLQQAKTSASTFLTDVTDIATIGNNSVALKSDGTVWTVGANNLCQLGIGGCVTPGTNQFYWTQVLTGASKINVGYDFTVVLKADGSLWGVGANTAGQLGLGNSVNQTTWQNSATDVLDFWVGITDIFIKKSDGIYATGVNTNGQFGIGNQVSKNVFTKVSTLDGFNIVKMGLGSAHSYALASNGNCLATGYNYYGQLGQGDFVRQLIWQPFSLTNVSDIASGYYHSIFKKTDGTVWSVGGDNYAQLGLGVFPYKKLPVTILVSTKQASPFNSSGTVIGLKLNAVTVVKWVNVLWDGAIPEGTAIKVRTRGAPTEEGLATVAWSEVITSSGTPLTTPNSQWLELEVVLESSDGAFTPAINSLTVTYYSDVQSPSNPTTIQGWSDNTKTTEYLNNTWHNDNSVYLEWNAAVDVGESGIKGYWVYFGNDQTADPLTAGTWQIGTSKEVNIPDTDTGKTLYLCISAEDNAGNRFVSPSEPFYKVLTYKFDKTAPILSNANITVSPVGWSTVNSFNFSWTDGEDPSINNNSSGISEYFYKIGGDPLNESNWISNGTEKLVTGITAYQNGQNTFYIKAKDSAGNFSDYKSNFYYYNGVAPTPPQNLAVTPQSSLNNSFTFSWDAPVSANGGVKGYYYSVNTTPNALNTVYTTSDTTGVIPAATQQSFNTFYVVAKDNSDNINWGNFSSIQFECNTTAPGIPGGVVVSDSSNMAATDWALTTKWQVPSTGNVDHYAVYRSTDGKNYSKVAETASTGYLDSGLSNTSTYYYKITAVDNAGAESGFSSVVSKQPTGKFAQAPIILDGPEISAKATNTTISWTTDRPSSSFVAFGKTEGNLNDSKGQLDSANSHSVTLWGLDPGTTYYYKVQSFDENRDYPTSEAFSNVYNFKTQPAPAIEDVDVSDVGLYNAVITWKTTSSATSKIIYGKTGTYDRSIEDKSGSQTTIHTVQLEDLDHSSSYNFKILGTDVDENKLESDNYFFQTLVYPKVSNVRFEQQKNTATATIKVTWDSNVPLTSVAEHKEASAGNFKEVSSSKLTSKHELSIVGLRDNTDYLVQVQGRDAHGNLAVSDINKVRTDFDTRPPEIFDITTETSIVGYGSEAKSQVILSWETDEPSTSQILYEVGIGGDAHPYKTQEDGTFSTTHVVVISGLKPSTVYHFHAVSADSSGNKTISEETSLLTEQAASSVLDIVINSLENSLGWLFKIMKRN